MADVKKRGFKTVETNYEEVDSQIRQHRKMIIRRAIEVVAIVVVLVVAIELLYALRSF